MFLSSSYDEEQKSISGVNRCSLTRSEFSLSPVFFFIHVLDFSCCFERFLDLCFLFTLFLLYTHATGVDA